MRPFLCLLLLCSGNAFAQEDPDSSGDDAPSMVRPQSDSPEAIQARKYDGPRHRAQAFLIPMDEAARTPATRVARAVETVLLHTPIYQVVDLGDALSVESSVEQGQKAEEGRRLVAEGNSAATAKGEIAPRKGARQSITLAATPTAASLNQIIAGAADEVGRGTAGKSSSALAEKFSLGRLLIGSVRSQEQSRVSVVLALVDAMKHRIIAAKTLTLSADGTDADQIELDTQTAARKLIAADAAGTETAGAPSVAPAVAESSRKPVMPGAIPATAEPGLAAHQRKVAIPVMATEPPAPASKEALQKQQEKKKSKGLKGKTGTEEWGDE